MPKLPTTEVNTVNNTEAAFGGNFEPLKPGFYLAQLRGVEVRDSKRGGSYWSVEFHNIYSLDGEKQPGRQWMNLNLPSVKPLDGQTESKHETYNRMSRQALAGFFEAFGYTADSDTDEMLGEWAVLQIGVRTIQSGPRAGEKANQVTALKAVPDDVEIPAVDTDDDVF